LRLRTFRQIGGVILIVCVLLGFVSGVWLPLELGNNNLWYLGYILPVVFAGLVLAAIERVWRSQVRRSLTAGAKAALASLDTQLLAEAAEQVSEAEEEWGDLNLWREKMALQSALHSRGLKVQDTAT